MKNKNLFFMTVFAALTLSSCGFTRDVASNQNSLQTNVVLSEKNFKVVKNVKGTSSSTYVFGLGGLSKRALTSSSVSDMMAQADMIDKAQGLAHVQTVVSVKTILGIYTKRTATTTGTVVEFVE